MSIYTKKLGLSDGLTVAINHALTDHILEPSSGILPQLLDGTDKVLVIEWNGDLDASHRDGYHPERHDGRLHLLRPGQPGYQVPPSHDEDDAAANLRAGVPLWVVQRRLSLLHPTVLGIGKVHPLYNSATIEFYDHITRKKLVQIYFADPRCNVHELPQEGPLSIDDERQRIAASGGAIEPGPMVVPRYLAEWI